MATGTVLLDVESAVPSDGSASNAAPSMVRFQGTDASPKKHFLALAFDGTAAEYVTHAFRLPTDYASGGTLKIQWMINATANAVFWAAKVAAITPADVDTPVEHVPAAEAGQATNANATEARRLIETSITLTMDSAAAGDLILLLLYRDPVNAGDTSAVDAELVAAAFEYTTT